MECFNETLTNLNLAYPKLEIKKVNKTLTKLKLAYPKLESFLVIET